MTSIIPRISYLSKSIIRVLGCNPSPMTLQGTNTYIIGTGKKRVLFDTGEHQNNEYLANLSKILKENDIYLDTVIISHWHHDHIGGLEDVLKLTDGSKVRVLKYPRTDQPEKLSVDIQYIAGDEKIAVEGATLGVHHTPGHTTDHIVLRLEEESAVFSGDCILGEGTAVFEDLADYMKSLQTILDLEPSIIYPGHGPQIEDPMDRIRFYIDHRNEREAQIMEVFDGEKNQTFTPMNLVTIIYKETPLHLHMAAAGNVLHHLKKLKKEGKIECVDSEKSLWRRVTTTSNL